MPADGSVGQKQALADLSIRQPRGRELCDLELLGGESIARIRCSVADCHPCRSELLPGTFAPLRSAQGVEPLDALTQQFPRISYASLSAQPSAERVGRPRVQERQALRLWPSAASKVSERRRPGQQRSRGNQLRKEERRFAPPSDGLEFGDDVGKSVGVPAANSGLDQVEQAGPAHEPMEGYMAVVKDCHR